MYVFDSCILIDAIRKTERFHRIRKVLGNAPIITTSISLHELLVGAKSEKQRFVVEHLFAGMRVLPYDAEAAKHSGRIERDLLDKGKTIDTPDAMIAAICKVHGAELVTADTDFSRIPGLKIQVVS